ncbi:hypothetical protein D302_gp133 [Campylobacter phage CP30A]|uniref:Uncharacterized protein n=1 Tax=Campylobacter phage CP30A TaxID=1229752 RepID=J9SPE7_9CAUD|nr:hypothetical protein D302_gp133 [Campylobacter phage CP30A]AFR52445.1 hypothetical protein [Campylobacter phage CP30A]
MVSTVFENDYVEVVTRKDAEFIVENFIKTCDCDWNDDENCDKCASIDNLKFHLEDNPNCLIFVRYKYKTPEGREEWRWSTRRYVSSISEYIEEELESDIELVKSEMGEK